MTAVEAAQTALDRARQEVREAERQVTITEAEIARFVAKESINTQDFVAHENAQRRLPRLRKDLEDSQQAAAVAEAALTVAIRDRDLAAFAEVQGRITPLREKLFAIVCRIADDPAPVEHAAWAAVHDPAFVKDLRTTINALQAHASRWVPGPSLMPGEGVLDSGPWISFDGEDGYPLFAALCARARDLLEGREAARWAEEQEAERVRREAEERAQAEREKAERDSLEPQLIDDGNGKMRWRYPKKAARMIPVPQAQINLARTDPHRALAQFDGKLIALIEAKDKEARAALRGARERNKNSGLPQKDPPAYARDLRDSLDRGTRIEVHHHPELLEEP